MIHKKNHINILTKQLKGKLVLAKTIKLFQFLIPKHVLKIIIELDSSFEIKQYSSLTPKQVVIDLFNDLKYGEKYIEKICKLFPSLLDENELLIQCKTYRHHLLYAYFNNIKYTKYWYLYTSNEEWIGDNEDLYILVSMLIVVCLSSVNCERGFSQMNIIKSILSNRMLVNLVCAILTIKQSGWPLSNEILFYEDQIIEQFKEQKSRRCAYNTK